MSERPDESGRERAYREFMTPGPLPENANLPDAEARLLGALERELGVQIAPARIARVSRIRPLLAFAAVLAAAAGLAWTQGALRNRHAAPVLRGSETPAPGTWTAHGVATQLGDGRTKLAWAPAAQATLYGVTFLGDDLQELARVDSLASTSLILDRAALPKGLASGRNVLWRVTAYAGRDEVARSPASPLTVP